MEIHIQLAEVKVTTNNFDKLSFEISLPTTYLGPSIRQIKKYFFISVRAVIDTDPQFQWTLCYKSRNTISRLQTYHGY